MYIRVCLVVHMCVLYIYIWVHIYAIIATQGGCGSFSGSIIRSYRRGVVVHGWQSESTDVLRDGWGSDFFSPSIFFCFCLSMYLSIGLSACTAFYVSVYLSMYLPIDLSTDLSAYLSAIHLSSIFLSIHLSFLLSSLPSICQSIFLSFHLIYSSNYLYLSI